MGTQERGTPSIPPRRLPGGQHLELSGERAGEG